MYTKTENLGKVAVTVDKNYWSRDKEYDRLTIVPVEGQFATYISRKPVPAGIELTDREYWIPFSSLKEDIVISYNNWVETYGNSISELNQASEEAQQQLQQISEEIQNQIDDMNENIQSLQQEVSNLRSGAVVIEGGSSNISSLLQEHDDHIAGLINNLALNFNNYVNMNENMTSINESIAALNATSNNHELRITQNEADIALLKNASPSNDLSGRVGILESAVSTNTNNISTLQTTTSSNTNRIEVIESQMGLSSGNEGEGLADHLNAIDSDITSVQNAVTSVSNRVSTLENTVGTQSEQLVTLQSTIGDAQQETGIYATLKQVTERIVVVEQLTGVSESSQQGGNQTSLTDKVTTLESNVTAINNKIGDTIPNNKTSITAALTDIYSQLGVTNGNGEPTDQTIPQRVAALEATLGQEASGGNAATGIQAELDGKADSSYVQQELDSKADLSYVLTELNKKANTTDIKNSTITILKNGSTIDSFTTNQVSDKIINITVPTNTNQLTNGANFVTKDTSNLENYYQKTETYSKDEIDGMTFAGNNTDLSSYAKKSELASVATSGNYSDLSGKPNIGTAAAKNIPSSGNAANDQVVLGNDTRLTNARTPTAHTHTKSLITDFPTLATVATTGSYNDLTDKPTISATQIQSDWNQTDNTAKDYIKNKPNIWTGTEAQYNTLFTNTSTPCTDKNGNEYLIVYIVEN